MKEYYNIITDTDCIYIKGQIGNFLKINNKYTPLIKGLMSFLGIKHRDVKASIEFLRFIEDNQQKLFYIGADGRVTK